RTISSRADPRKAGRAQRWRDRPLAVRPGGLGAVAGDFCSAVRPAMLRELVPFPPPTRLATVSRAVRAGWRVGCGAAWLRSKSRPSHSRVAGLHAANRRRAPALAGHQLGTFVLLPPARPGRGIRPFH